MGKHYKNVDDLIRGEEELIDEYTEYCWNKWDQRRKEETKWDWGDKGFVLEMILIGIAGGSIGYFTGMFIDFLGF